MRMPEARNNSKGKHMSSDYRVRYKNGEVEIEVQSADKEYVGMMIEKLLQPYGATSIATNSGARARKATKKALTKASEGGISEANIDAVKVANMVNEADNLAVIEKHILKNTSRIAKVILAFHFAHACGFKQLSSGDVVKITDELGVKVEKSSASHIDISKNVLGGWGATKRGENAV
jgi:hypothetical protein